MSDRPPIKLEPLKSIDIETCSDVVDVLISMSRASFGGRQIGEAWRVLRKIADDPHCALVLTVSGAMSIAKLGRIFGSFIANSIVRAVITTGAVVTHSLIEECGMCHYKAPRNLTDTDLYNLKLNRIYDSIEPESNLEKLEILARKTFSMMVSKGCYGSFDIIRLVSSGLLNRKKKTGFLGSALKYGVNVYVPALSDSELGLYLFRYVKYSRGSNQNHIVYDPFRDLSEYSRWLCSQKHVAFLTLGGGVPRNWAQQMLPFLKAQQEAGELTSNARLPKIVAAIRICPDPAELGHLSGSTYSEGITWGKLDPEKKENFVEVCCDATIVFPVLAKLLLDYIKQKEK